ncbi:hypothetical protein HK101_008322 [Irineochytrium annulatum]|nr:hypothetical protein HK101_008322 [Irineochytrium annulatum]
MVVDPHQLPTPVDEAITFKLEGRDASVGSEFSIANEPDDIVANDQLAHRGTKRRLGLHTSEVLPTGSGRPGAIGAGARLSNATPEVLEDAPRDAEGNTAICCSPRSTYGIFTPPFEKTASVKEEEQDEVVDLLSYGDGAVSMKMRPIGEGKREPVFIWHSKANHQWAKVPRGPDWTTAQVTEWTQYFYFILERFKIQLKRAAGDKRRVSGELWATAPWTEDWVLQHDHVDDVVAAIRHNARSSAYWAPILYPNSMHKAQRRLLHWVFYYHFKLCGDFHAMQDCGDVLMYGHARTNVEFDYMIPAIKPPVPDRRLAPLVKAVPESNGRRPFTEKSLIAKSGKRPPMADHDLPDEDPDFFCGFGPGARKGMYAIGMEPTMEDCWKLTKIINDALTEVYANAKKAQTDGLDSDDIILLSYPKLVVRPLDMEHALCEFTRYLNSWRGIWPSVKLDRYVPYCEVARAAQKKAMEGKLAAYENFKQKYPGLCEKDEERKAKRVKRVKRKSSVGTGEEHDYVVNRARRQPKRIERFGFESPISVASTPRGRKRTENDGHGMARRRDAGGREAKVEDGEDQWGFGPEVLKAEDASESDDGEELWIILED